MNGHGDSRPVVLIVDDDPSLRLIICSFAIENGYFPIDTSCAEGAKLLLEQKKPDLAIIDGYMPGMNGFNLCEFIKSNPETKNIPVIMITGLDDDKSVRQAYDAGAQEFITKPIHWAVLRHRMALFSKMSKAKQKKTDALSMPDNKDTEQGDILCSISQISNDFQTQVHEILSYARIGKSNQGELQPSKIIDFFSSIEKSGEQLLTLLDDIRSKLKD